ncbi:MAG TPA: extracellular solute-binding protein [Acetobacteraceae bacterium]|nr:extracellular solute-binding protein [Acetobacteraceae bacterium]
MRTLLVAAMLAASPALADTATVMAYSDGPFQDNYTATVLDPYNRQGGPNRAEFHGSASSATMLGELRTQKTAPQVDVVIMDTTTAAIACAEGLIEKITPDMLPMLGDLDKQALDANGCGPAVTFDHFIIAYDTKTVQPAPTSLVELRDPKWKGRVSLSAPPNIQALALTAILAQSESGDWHKPDGAFKTLREIAPNVQTFDPQPDGYTLILNDTLAFATGWNARAQLFRDRSQGRVGVMLPKEGTVLQLNMINLVKGAPHREAGLAFMRYALSPDAQKAFTERMFYGPTNTKAQIAPDAAARTSAGPESKPRIIAVDWNEMVKLRDNWTQRWRREVIAAGGR